MRRIWGIGRPLLSWMVLPAFRAERMIRTGAIAASSMAVDAAGQSKLLGAANVPSVYRCKQDQMSASTQEQENVSSKGVRINRSAVPLRTLSDGSADRLESVEFARTEGGSDGLRLTDETFRIKADQVFKAIGQHLASKPEYSHLEAPGWRCRAGRARSNRRQRGMTALAAMTASAFTCRSLPVPFA